MIGQRIIAKQIDTWYSENTLPKFLIVAGLEGGGKKTVLSYISEKFGYPLVYFENKIEGVRQLIEICYNQTRPIIYAIADADKMSGQGQNALLKIAEEPPTNAHIAVTTCSDTLLPTIKSRGVQVVLEAYTRKEKEQYVKQVLKKSMDKTLEQELELSDTLWDISVFERCDFTRLQELCNNIVHKIGSANIGSALKIAQNINTKDKGDADVFEMDLFLKTLAGCYHDEYLNCGDKKLYDAYYNVLQAKKQLTRNYNKSYVLDELLLKLQGSYAV